MDKFTKVRNIGKGNMGACALARNNEDGKFYVIKQVDLSAMNKKERQQSLNEAKVLSSLRHPNVINYVDSFLATRSDHLCIVMEYADGGDINARIKQAMGANAGSANINVNNRAHPFSETQVLDWFIQLVLSLNYVHSRKILHRDVKSQNVFLTSDNIVKLGDFGIARTLSGTYDQARTFVGTPYYLSPELILERPYDARSDVWAMGVVLYEMLTFKHPFNATDMKGLMQRILRVQYDPVPQMYSSNLRNIIPRLLVREPSQRIRLSEALELPIIHKRLCEWFLDGVMPKKYVESLINHHLFPPSVVADVKAQLAARGLTTPSSPERKSLPESSSASSFSTAAPGANSNKSNNNNNYYSSRTHVVNSEGNANNNDDKHDNNDNENDNNNAPNRRELRSYSSALSAPVNSSYRVQHDNNTSKEYYNKYNSNNNGSSNVSSNNINNNNDYGRRDNGSGASSYHEGKLPSPSTPLLDYRQRNVINVPQRNDQFNGKNNIINKIKNLSVKNRYGDNGGINRYNKNNNIYSNNNSISMSIGEREGMDHNDPNKYTSKSMPPAQSARDSERNSQLSSLAPSFATPQRVESAECRRSSFNEANISKPEVTEIDRNVSNNNNNNIINEENNSGKPVNDTYGKKTSIVTNACTSGLSPFDEDEINNINNSKNNNINNNINNNNKYSNNRALGVLGKDLNKKPEPFLKFRHNDFGGNIPALQNLRLNAKNMPNNLLGKNYHLNGLNNCRSNKQLAPVVPIGPMHSATPLYNNNNNNNSNHLLNNLSNNHASQLNSYPSGNTGKGTPSALARLDNLHAQLNRYKQEQQQEQQQQQQQQHSCEEQESVAPPSLSQHPSQMNSPQMPSLSNLYDKYKNSPSSSPSPPTPAPLPFPTQAPLHPLTRDLGKVPNTGNINNGSFNSSNNNININSGRSKDVNQPMNGLRNIVPKYQSHGTNSNLATNDALTLLKQNLNLQRNNNNSNANKAGRRAPQLIETASIQMDIKELLQRAAHERAQRRVNNAV